MRTLLSDYAGPALPHIFFLAASERRKGLQPSSVKELLVLLRTIKAYTQCTEVNYSICIYSVLMKYAVKEFYYALLTQVICLQHNNNVNY